MYCCHSIPECYNLFCGVKLSIRLFCFISVQSVNIFYKSVEYTLSTMNLEPLIKVYWKYTAKRSILQVYYT